MNTRTIYALALIVTLSGCAGTMTMPGGAIEAEICRQWGYSLATRSRQDTAQTQDEIQRSYAAFALACPAYRYLVP